MSFSFWWEKLYGPAPFLNSEELGATVSGLVLDVNIPSAIERPVYFSSAPSSTTDPGAANWTTSTIYRGR